MALRTDHIKCWWDLSNIAGNINIKWKNSRESACGDLGLGLTGKGKRELSEVTVMFCILIGLYVNQINIYICQNSLNIILRLMLSLYITLNEGSCGETIANIESDVTDMHGYNLVWNVSPKNSNTQRKPRCIGMQ